MKMNDTIKKGLLSVLACTLLVGFGGCMGDRANFGSGIGGMGNLNPTPDDLDGDGLTNDDETNIYHTDPNNPDTDGDGLSDGEEVVKYNTDPLKADTDGDGLNDKKEIEIGTDPNNPDTDGDGLSDGEEVNTYQTDPLKADTDGDGLNDGLEAKRLPTNPLKADTDADGVTDGIEVVGTYAKDVASNGKVITAAKGKYEIKDGVLNLSVPLSIGDFEGESPANLHHNSFTDPDDKIDALDPMNDSDYDKHPNKAESDKGSDPLDQNSKYSFIYETPKGRAMEAAGFVYVPAIDARGGFWLSQYEARPAETTPLTLQIDDFNSFVQSHFVTLTGDTPSGFDSFDISGIPLYKVNFKNDLSSQVGNYGFEAAYMLDQSQIAGGEPIGLPTLRQYEHALKMVNDQNDDTVRNSVFAYDSNVEEDYSRKVFELKGGVKEFTKTMVKLANFSKPSWLRGNVFVPPAGEGAIVGSATGGRIGAAQPYALAIKGNGFTDLRFSIAYGDNTQNAAIGFRGASGYIATDKDAL